MKDEAEIIRRLYQNYLSRMTLVQASSASGLKTDPVTVRLLLESRHKLSDMVYPAIIDKETFDKAVARADALLPEGMQKRPDELQHELVRAANDKQRYDAIADELFRLREQKRKAEMDTGFTTLIWNVACTAITATASTSRSAM